MLNTRPRSGPFTVLVLPAAVLGLSQAWRTEAQVHLCADPVRPIIMVSQWLASLARQGRYLRDLY